jgi:hypothetical protein
MQHQPFAATTHHFIELAFEHGAVSHAKLFHRDQLRPLRFIHDLTDSLRTLRKSAGSFGQFENQIFDLAPFGVLWLGLADDTRQRIKPSARQPKLAVQGLRRQFANKPRGRMDTPPAAKTQRLAIPKSAHAVEFFADQIIGRINLWPKFVGQEHWWRLRIDLSAMGDTPQTREQAQHPDQDYELSEFTLCQCPSG